MIGKRPAPTNTADTVQSRLLSHPILKYTTGSITIATLLTAAALIVYIPYLRSLGAQGFPAPGLSLYAGLTAFAFLFVNGIPAFGGVVIVNAISRPKHSSRLPKSTLHIAFLLVLVALNLWCAYRMINEPGSYAPLTPSVVKWRFAFVTWLTSAVGGGVLARFLYTLFTAPADAHNRYKNLTPSALTVLAIAILILWGGFFYSLSVFPCLPPFLGGQEYRAVRFSWKKEMPPVIRQVDEWTEPVNLVYDDSKSYWIQHLTDRRDEYAVDAYSHEMMGSPQSVQSAPQTPYERPVRWKLRYQER